jgi:hypothetical protein
LISYSCSIDGSYKFERHNCWSTHGSKSFGSVGHLIPEMHMFWSFLTGFWNLETSLDSPSTMKKCFIYACIMYIYIIIINKYYIRYAHYFGSFTNCYGYLEGLMSAKCSLRKSRRCFGRESPGHVRHLGTLRLAGHGFSNNELGTWKQERGFKDLFLRVVLL